MSGWAEQRDTPSAGGRRAAFSPSNHRMNAGDGGTTPTNAAKNNRVSMHVKNADSVHLDPSSLLSSTGTKTPTKEQLLLRPRVRAAKRCGCGAPTCDKCGLFIFPSDTHNTARTAIITLFALYNTVFTPLVASFQPEWGSHGAVVAVDYVVDFGFVIHLVLLFVTGYLDDFGRLVYRRKLIKERVLNCKLPDVMCWYITPFSF